MATKKTTTKKAKATTEERSLRVPQRIVELQKRSLEGQHKAFDRTFEAVDSFRERREDRVNEWMKASRFVPTEVAELATEWTDASRNMRSTYRKSVDKSFSIAENWVEGLA